MGLKFARKDQLLEILSILIKDGSDSPSFLVEIRNQLCKMIKKIEINIRENIGKVNFFK